MANNCKRKGRVVKSFGVDNNYYFFKPSGVDFNSKIKFNTHFKYLQIELIESDRRNILFWPAANTDTYEINFPFNAILCGLGYVLKKIKEKFELYTVSLLKNVYLNQIRRVQELLIRLKKLKFIRIYERNNLC